MTLRGLDVEAHLRDPALKQRFVTPMFDIIAPRYDRFTRLFSFGMDRRWKNGMLDEIRSFAGPDSVALDIACGTGDLALALSRLASGGHVTGVDASERMVGEARRRAAAQGDRRVRFEVGDMMRLTAPDASVDLVTAGYAFRNVPDPAAALREVARVLRPGGRLLTLDFYRPESALWRQLLVRYLWASGNLVGWLWHREPVVYGYIARSVEHWMSWQAFGRALESAGLDVERVDRMLLGGVAIHRALRR